MTIYGPTGAGKGRGFRGGARPGIPNVFRMPYVGGESGVSEVTPHVGGGKAGVPETTTYVGGA